jgi:hypothetical protein
MKRIFYIVLLSLSLGSLHSQELWCSVEVRSDQIQTSERRIYETMRNAIYEFMNNQQWTNYNYKPSERIECSMLINVQDRPSTDFFRCQLTIALRRPVFNSTYNTPLLNYIDKDVEFEYLENQPLDFSAGVFTSNLTSILGFYSYLMIGLDFDSFMLNGGDPYYEAAQNIVNSAQTSGYSGWGSAEGTKNRYWLLENITNPSYSGLRSFFYEYHREGLDIMHEEPEKGREAILSTLSYLQQVKQSRPSLLILQVISDTKRDEYVNVFSEGIPTQKSNAVKLLNEIDPSNAMTYQKIIQN